MFSCTCVLLLSFVLDINSSQNKMLTWRNASGNVKGSMLGDLVRLIAGSYRTTGGIAPGDETPVNDETVRYALFIHARQHGDL